MVLFTHGGGGVSKIDDTSNSSMQPNGLDNLRESNENKKISINACFNKKRNCYVYKSKFSQLNKNEIHLFFSRDNGLLGAAKTRLKRPLYLRKN
ncbi:unnamed protein product [Blepharisma stoltei]|uniref:Uncharacterized protein n=1 Tax=Blepharisma stoltei TaxID=1481888 RepID=A0AAU9JQ86_9CILI|nr:unnamed protein product [Blepharisma stoltei]